ncbi:MAG: hypothetical protein VXZ26_05765, partial [Pseudomonadota bacterium]|nr:hypothetical protein [Pseudomonadota bacterium]
TRLTAKVDSANKDELVTWFTRGGMVAGVGILLGVMLTYLPKRTRRCSVCLFFWFYSWTIKSEKTPMLASAFFIGLVSVN